MGDSHERATWELAAEELVRHVRSLLDDHADAIEKALRKSVGRDEAESQVQQLGLLVQVLEIELWRKGAGRAQRDLVHFIARGIKLALASAGLTLTTLATTQAYEAIAATTAQADQVVVQCAPPDGAAVTPELAEQLANARREANSIIEEAREAANQIKRDQELQLQRELAELRDRAVEEMEAKKAEVAVQTAELEAKRVEVAARTAEFEAKRVGAGPLAD